MIYFRVGSRCLVDSHWRWNKNHSVSAYEKEWNRPFRGLVNFFVCFLVDLDCGDCFLGLRQNHIQVLIECLQEIIVHYSSLQFHSRHLHNKSFGIEQHLRVKLLSVPGRYAVSRRSSHPSSSGSSRAVPWLELWVNSGKTPQLVAEVCFCWLI